MEVYFGVQLLACMLSQKILTGTKSTLANLVSSILTFHSLSLMVIIRYFKIIYQLITLPQILPTLHFHCMTTLAITEPIPFYCSMELALEVTLVARWAALMAMVITISIVDFL